MPAHRQLHRAPKKPASRWMVWPSHSPACWYCCRVLPATQLCHHKTRCNPTRSDESLLTDLLVLLPDAAAQRHLVGDRLAPLLLCATQQAGLGGGLGAGQCTAGRGWACNWAAGGLGSVVATAAPFLPRLHAWRWHAPCMPFDPASAEAAGIPWLWGWQHSSRQPQLRLATRTQHGQPAVLHRVPRGCSVLVVLAAHLFRSTPPGPHHQQTGQHLRQWVQLNRVVCRPQAG